jgi:transposase-like protein
MKGGKAKGKENDGGKAVNGLAVGQNQTRRALRRKMDFTEQQLSQIDLKTLDSYKDFTVREFSNSLNKKTSAG